MDNLQNWLVSLDLTNMDALLLGYTSFLAKKIKPESITFLHILEAPDITDELKEMFPELEAKTDVGELIREELQEKIDSEFKDSVKTNLVLGKGDPTRSIISELKKLNPDLLVLGKKERFKGEGILSKKITRYVPCPVLFVPESVRYHLEEILVPFNFNDHSAAGIRFAESFADATDARLNLQHVYEYPAQFFPFLPSNEFEQKMEKQLNDEFAGFKKKQNISLNEEPVFTLNKQDKQPAKIYDHAIRIKCDLIIAGTRTKTNLASFLEEDLSDKLVNYNFGIPLMIYKDKKKNRGLLESLFKK